MGTRIIAFLIVVAGILTFFHASVTVAPSVLGVARWSPFKMVVAMYEGELPPPSCERCSEPLVRSLVALPLSITVEFVLFTIALIALLFWWRSKATTVIAGLGIYTTLRGGWGVGTRLEFLNAFYGSSSRGRVQYHELLITHLVLMAALLLASLDLLDDESVPEKTKGSRRLVSGRKPEV